jgi:hypothetical protein
VAVKECWRIATIDESIEPSP